MRQYLGQRLLRHSRVRTSARNVLSDSVIHCVWTDRVTETAKRRDIYLQVFLASLLVGASVSLRIIASRFGTRRRLDSSGEGGAQSVTHFPHAAGGTMSTSQHDCSTCVSKWGSNFFCIMLTLSVRVMRMVALCTPTPPLPHYTFDPLVTQHHDDSGRRPYSDRRIRL